MLGQLVKLAFRSAQLRESALRKEAALLGAVAKGIGGTIAKHPGKSLAIGLGGLSAGQAVAEKTKEFKVGFDPNSQKQMLGQAPTPPGV